jgi:tetratricopeptide (TPR) repeat protein
MSKIPVELRNAITNNELVLFIGAGLSFNLVNTKDQKLLGWDNLVLCILENLKENGHEVDILKPLVGKYEPIKILDLIESDKILPKKEIYKFVKTFYELKETSHLELHEKLFRLSSKIITTNYDTAFEDAVPKLRKHKAYKGKNYELTTHKDKEAPLLFKLHGCCEDADSMVLFPSNYKNLYENSERDAEHSILVLKNIIVNKTILFIGVGLGDFQINNIFKEVKKILGDYNQRHFILTNKSLDSALNFLTPIPFSDYSEIEPIIGELLYIKKEAEGNEMPEVKILRKELEDAQKRIEELSVNKYEEELSEKSRLLEREALKYFRSGLEYSLSNEYLKAIGEYENSVELKPNFYEALYNCGTALGNLAENKTEKEADQLYKQAFAKFQRAIEIKPDKHEAYNNWGTYLGRLAENKTEKEADQLYKQAFAKFQRAIEIKPDKHEAYNNWGTGLGKLAQTKVGKEADQFYEQAFEKYERAIELKSDFYQAFNNWGSDLGKLAQTKTEKESEQLYERAFEKYQRAIDTKPDFYEALSNWGTYLGKLAQTKAGKEADQLYKQAFEKYQKAIEIKPNYYDAFYNWGSNLGDLAETKLGKDREEFYDLAFEKFQKAIDIKPEKHEVLNNWGLYLGNLAQTKEGKNKEDLYEQAFEKFQKAIDIKPDKWEVLNNWANYLASFAQTKAGKNREELFEQAFEKYQMVIAINPNLYQVLYNWGLYIEEYAETKVGSDKEELYEQAFEKYQRAIDANPHFYNALNNWGNALGKLALTKTGKEAEELYEQAFEKLKKAIEYGASPYNLSCLYALKGEKENALMHLKNSLSNKQIDAEYVEKDNDWKGFFDDQDFKNLLDKYRKKGH